MKKIVMTLAFTLSLIHAKAQTETKTVDNFNKWSIELNGGFNKVQRPFTSSNYYNKRISPFTVDLSARYMLNNKFGFKADFGYNNLTEQKNHSLPFDSKYYRADLQAVINLGRIMNFETWTNTFGLLAHGALELLN